MKTRQVIMEQKFRVAGTFQSYYAACHFVKDMGYSYGSMCRDMPIGLLKGDYDISKWRNLTVEKIKQLDGVMTSSDFREGEVIVKIYEP